MELGQIASGHTALEVDCPNFIEAGLQYLAYRIETAAWNKNQESFDAPTGNCGSECKTSTFEMRSYCWSEDSPQAELPNFKCGNFEARWYKYCGRGMSMNYDISTSEFFGLIDDCIDSLRDIQIRGIDYDKNK